MAKKGVDGAGAGDVIGPASSTTGNFVSFSDSTGKNVQDSGKSSTDFETSGAAATVQGNLDTHTGNTTDAHGIDNKVDTSDSRLSDARTPTEHGNDKHSTNYEAELGDPDSDGKVLSSTAAGVRSWINVITDEPLTVASSEPTVTITDFWFDSVNEKLFVHDGSDYQPAMPVTSDSKNYAYQILLGLGTGDGSWLESWLGDTSNLAGYNQVMADATMMSTLLGTIGTVTSISNSATAIQAALNNSSVSRTLLFTSPYTLSVIWSTGIAVSAIADYFDDCTKGTLGVYGGTLIVPFDCSLIKGASIYARTSSIDSQYDFKSLEFYYDGSTAGTDLINDTNITTWTSYSNTTVDSELDTYGTSDGYLYFWCETDSTAPKISYVASGESPDGEKPVISFSKDGSTSPHYFWGLEFVAE